MREDIGQGSVLIVATRREDQRALFDALASHDFDAIYTAKDLEQARAFIERDPQIDVVLMEFVGAGSGAVAFCNQLAADVRLASVPVIGIVGVEHRQWALSNTPPGVVDWLSSPVNPFEALERVQAALIERHRIAAMANVGTAAITDIPVLEIAPPESTMGAPSSEIRDYRFAFDASPDEIVLSDPKTGLIIDVNTTFERRSGVSRGQAIGKKIHSLNLEHTQDAARAVEAQLVREGSAQYPALRMRSDGSTSRVQAQVRLAMQSSRVVHVTLFREQRDPAAHYQAALDVIVKAAECGGGDEGLNRIARLLSDWLELDFALLVTTSAEPSEEASILAAYRRLGLPHDAPDPLAQPTLAQVLGGDSVLLVDDAWKRLDQDRFLAMLRLQAFIGVPIFDERQNVLGALLLGRRQAISADLPLASTLRAVAARVAGELELRSAREQGRAKSLQDGLTGLPNRLLFNDRLETTIKEAHRSGEMFAVLFVDLDRFKSINDSLGHSVGDQVLTAVAKRMRAAVRGSDTVARYAGDEFVIILRHIVQRDDVMRVAEKIVRLMEAPQTLEDGSELHITSSIGVSFYPDDATTAEHLLKYSDIAMYSAKGMGRNNFQAYVAVPEESHQQRLELESKLRVAERNNQLRVYYQPQVDAKTEDIVGMEALIRWEHPELGMISPAFFIPLAEETGLILSIGEWVLRTACADARRWQNRFGLSLRVGVNLSAIQLRQPNLVQIVADALREEAFDAELLDLELTESVSMKSTPNLMETMTGLRNLGVKISIDDFGTGQSSLDYIKRFPADRIKIDQTFVRNIGMDPDDEAIVRATIEMAHNLNRGVVAEGVETEEHMDFLRTAGCEELQGYLFCRPLSATSFENMLIERERIFANLERETD
jgi:diguanylate cyclase (GGDEF)-like protein/PAS domain S-box-containing protein